MRDERAFTTETSHRTCRNRFPPASAASSPPRPVPNPARAVLLSPPGSSAVICNGVIGWGLDDPVEAERSVDAAWTALRPGGHLVVGWNDVARHRPFDVTGLAALRRFEPVAFPPLGAARHAVDHDMRHTFAFYAKPAA